jgi:hypothetical protein
VKEVTAAEYVLFIDEIHTLVGAGGGEGAMDAANILKPASWRTPSYWSNNIGRIPKIFRKTKP